MSARDARQLHELVNDLASLNSERPQPTLRREEPRGGIPSKRGYAEKNYQPGSGEGGAGIASPLTEGAGGRLELARTYHPKRTLRSSDGLFVWEVAPVATIRFTDANGGAAEFRLAVPTEPDP